MIVTVVKTEGLYGLAEVKIANNSIFVMDNFSNENSKIDELNNLNLIDPQFSALFFDLDWNVIFSLNEKKEKKLIRNKSWEYEAFGEISSINPVIGNFGLISLELGNFSNDPNLISNFIYMKIARLDLYKK